MELTKEDKAELKKIYNSKSFKILLKAFNNKKLSLLNDFYNADLWLEQTRIDLNSTQNHIKWMESIINIIKSSSNEKVETIKSLR